MLPPVRTTPGDRGPETAGRHPAGFLPGGFTAHAAPVHGTSARGKTPNPWGSSTPHRDPRRSLTLPENVTTARTLRQSPGTRGSVGSGSTQRPSKPRSMGNDVPGSETPVGASLQGTGSPSRAGPDRVRQLSGSGGTGSSRRAWTRTGPGTGAPGASARRGSSAAAPCPACPGRRARATGRGG